MAVLPTKSTPWGGVALLFRPLCHAVAVCALGAIISAQKPSPPAFEVASVKQNKSGDTNVELGVDGARFTATNVTLAELIRIAFDVQDRELVGGSSWIRSDHFDIVAKADAALQPGAAPPQLRQLLEERFRLTVHHESLEQPIYALVLSKRDGTLGPGLRRSPIDGCAQANARTTAQPAASNDVSQCAFRLRRGSVMARSMPVAQLVKRLVPLVSRSIADRTGLMGIFDYDLAWTPDDVLASSGAADDPTAPSIFTALEDQLGLKLESSKGPVDVLVIDSVEHPTKD